MIQQTHSYTMEEIPDIPMFRDTDPVFLDIETTGLGWRSSHLTLVGLLFRENGGWTMRQLFLDHPFEEKEYLIELTALLDSRRNAVLLHFNGDTFDLPYLRNKYAFYELPVPRLLSAGQGIDLLRRIRPYKKDLGLPSLRQKDIEAFLSVSRKDLLDGEELIGLYQQYLLHASDEDLELLFLHNREDVLGLARIWPVLSYTEILGPGSEPEKFDMTEGTFRAEFRLSVPVPKPLTIKREYYSVTYGNDTATLEVPVFTGHLKHFFPDPSNYYFFPLEDQAIHRSVAVFSDPSHRVKATAATCYQYADGIFLPAPESEDDPLFYVGYRTRPAYIRISEEWTADREAVCRYIQTLLRN